MKKFLILFLSIFVLTACSEKTNVVKDPEPPKAEESTPVVKEEPKLEPIITKEITYADWAKNDVPLLTEEALSLSDQTYNFVSKNNDLFPAKTDGNILKVKELANYDITIPHLNKNVVPYYEEIFTAEGVIISIEELNLDNGEILSYVHVYDDNDYSYILLMYKGTGDMLENDWVQFWGAPVGPYSFPNISGGFTNTQFFIASHIEKF